MHSYLGMYDISNDKIRRRVFRCLMAYGVHQQKSVFQCQLHLAQKDELLEQLDAITTGEQRHIVLIRIEANHPQTEFFGLKPVKMQPDCLYIG